MDAHRIIPCFDALYKVAQTKMRQPGIEPGASAWEALMLPLHHKRLLIFDRKIGSGQSMKIYLVEEKKKGRSGIRTRDLPHPKRESYH